MSPEEFFETLTPDYDIAGDIGLYWEVGISDAAQAMFEDGQTDEPGRAEFGDVLGALAARREREPEAAEAVIATPQGTLVARVLPIEDEDEPVVAIMAGDEDMPTLTGDRADADETTAVQNTHRPAFPTLTRETVREAPMIAREIAEIRRRPHRAGPLHGIGR